jgi:UV DNA damage endonuclease
MNGSRLGYACINNGLNKRSKSDGGRVTTGRTCRKASWFPDKNYGLLGEKALANAQDLLTILKWNKENGVYLFRIGGEIIPWHDHFVPSEVLPQYDEIKAALFECGEYAREHGMRITTHPGPFHVLGSPNPAVVAKSIIGLERHSEIFDMMGFEPSFENKINIHIGGAYGDHTTTAARWIEGWDRLSDRCKKRLVIENDDKASMWSVWMLYQYFHKTIGIPITFDYFHHKFHSDGLTEEEALKLAAKTWPDGVRQCTHYSESRRKEKQKQLDQILKNSNIKNIEDFPTLLKEQKEIDKIKEQAHSDVVTGAIDTYGMDIDIVLEVKAKEQGLFECRNNNKELIN